LFSNPNKAVPVPIPKPSAQAMQWAEAMIPENAVLVFARNRKTYGRNLTPDFYAKLLRLLRDKGLTPVWCGEKVSSHRCPLPDVIDCSGCPDLEKVFALVCRAKFTVQFFTASSRLAGMMGKPYVLFETPDQLYLTLDSKRHGQEGKRQLLTTFGPSKIVIADFLTVLEHPAQALQVCDTVFDEVLSGDYCAKACLTADLGTAMQMKHEFDQLHQE